MPRRIRWAGLAVAIVASGCPKEPPPPPPPAEVAPADEPEPPAPKIDPKPLAPKAAEAAVEYKMREVFRKELGGKALTDTKIELTFSLSSVPKAPGSVVTVSVTGAKVKSEQGGRKVDFDAARPADIRRLNTLGDASLVAPFALIGKSFEVDLDERGHATAMRGGAEARAIAMKILGGEKAKAEVERQLSDGAILERLLPAAQYLPADGELEPGRRINLDDAVFSTSEYSGRATTAVLLSDTKDVYLRVRVRRIEGPQADVATPVRLVDGNWDLTVDFDHPSGLFQLANAELRRQMAYEGVLDGNRGTFPMNEETRRVWGKSTMLVEPTEAVQK